jgi:hypothetical protein
MAFERIATMFPILRNVEQTQRAKDFASLIRLMLVSNGSVSSARVIAEQKDYSPRIQAIVAKAQPGSLGGVGSPNDWGGELSDYSLVVGAFSASLRNIGVFDTLLAAANRVPLRSRTTVVQSATMIGDEVAEGDIKPLHELALAAANMPIKKYSAIVAVSEELLKLAGASESLITQETRNAVIAAIDNAFVDALVALTTPVASTGAALSDIGVLLSAITSGSNASLFAITTPAICKSFAVTAMAPGANGGGPAFPGFTATGGVIAGVRVLASDHIASGVMLGVDATGLAMAASELSISASSEASLQFGSPATPLTSLWQENLKAIRIERMASWQVLRAASIASVNNINYGTSP